jgi:glyoxylase-like metal-dependent hydrolase (beta-lactamase superfamily II)
VTVDSRVIVIDPCNGNGRDHPLALFNQLNTPYLERFAATGIRPADVDIVFCTHLHHDHCGWSTQLKNGRFVPTFPNARYVYVRREYERWQHPPARPPSSYDLNVGVFDHSVRPIVEAGLAEIVNATHRLTDSMGIEPAPGHTLGHSMLHLISAAQHAYFTGDVFHHPLQLLYPQLCMPGDDDRIAAIETRRSVLSLCVRNEALIVPAHFPHPHAGYARAEGDRTIFEPLPT